MNGPKIKDLYIVGIGIEGTNHMTLETQAVLRKCRTVFHVGDATSEIQKLCRNAIDLYDIYWSGRDRRRVYKEICSIIMKEVHKGRGVASMTYGHPIFCDEIHMNLIKRCRRARKTCQVLPAVSCLDTLSIDLGIDFLDPGLCLLEATDFVLSDRKIDPSLHTLIMQIGEFDVKTTSDTIDNWHERFRPLDDQLGEYYPKGHRVVACYSNDGEGLVKVRARIGSLCKTTHKFFPGMTLYVPPV